VKVKDGLVLSEQQVKDFCKGKIAHFKTPRYVMFVNDFPMGVTGKIQKFRMREDSIKVLGLEAAEKIETA
jgi:fatty-acyl-CoA synthase